MLDGVHPGSDSKTSREISQEMEFVATVPPQLHNEALCSGEVW